MAFSGSKVFFILPSPKYNSLLFKPVRIFVPIPSLARIEPEENTIAALPDFLTLKLMPKILPEEPV